MQRVRRVAMISMHTSPLATPGSGDAGGMNVYILEVAKRLAARGVQVDVFTRATDRRAPDEVAVSDRVTVRHVEAGPFAGLSKEQLPSQMCAFTGGVLRATQHPAGGRYDLVHSHYWLSGQVGWVAAERWGVPLVHSMHTMAKVKNLHIAHGDRAEPVERIIGEEQVVSAADHLVANTAFESEDLVRLYGADPARISIALPGVDLEAFRPGPRHLARRRHGLDDDAIVLLFVGRLQPLKAPDVLVRAAARLLHDRPALRTRLRVVINGGPSGTGIGRAGELPRLVGDLGLRDVVRFMDPVAREALPDLYRAADVTVVPSHSESFGLVAVESQACGTPVVASRVGGLVTAVGDGGELVTGHDPADFAAAIGALVTDPARRCRAAAAARSHAEGFSWAGTAEATLRAYGRALDGAAIPLRRYA